MDETRREPRALRAPVALLLAMLSIGATAQAPGDAIFGDDESTMDQEGRFVQRQILLAAPQIALEKAVLAGSIPRHLKPQLPGLTLIPVQRPQLGVLGRSP